MSSAERKDFAEVDMALALRRIREAGPPYPSAESFSKVACKHSNQGTPLPADAVQLAPPGTRTG
jgi:hypothetical protein